VQPFDHSNMAPGKAAPATNGTAVALSEALEASCTSDQSTAAAEEAFAQGYHKWLVSVSDRLAASGTAEHLHLSALLARNPATRIGLITRAVERAPSDPFVAWSAARLCLEPGGVECPQEDWQSRLVLLDSENSLAWVQQATYRYRVDDEAGALNALRRGASAATANDYFVDVISLSSQSLAAGSDLGFPDRAALSFGIAAQQFLPFGDLTAMCKEESQVSATWAYACLGLGEQLEAHGITELAAAIGIAVQLLALEGLDETEQASRVEARQRARRQKMDEAGARLVERQFRLITSTPRLFEAYLEEFRSQGEIAASTSLSHELQVLLDQRPDLA
jgi:hypothetical protein